MKVRAKVASYLCEGVANLADNVRAATVPALLDARRSPVAELTIDHCMRRQEPLCLTADLNH